MATLKFTFLIKEIKVINNKRESSLIGDLFISYDR